MRGPHLLLLLLFFSTSLTHILRTPPKHLRALASYRDDDQPERLDARDGAKGPQCIASTTYADNQLSVTVLAPNGTVLGAATSIQLSKSDPYNLKSALPWPLAISLDKKKLNLVLQYSQDPSWTVAPQATPTNSTFDCSEFKFRILSNFWQIGKQKTHFLGTLNWTMTSMDGTYLGGSPQTDILASANVNEGQPAAPLITKLNDIVRVWWGQDDTMTFTYGMQVVSYPKKALGVHETIMIGSTPPDVFSWTTSGVL